MLRALGLADAPVWLADGCNDAAIVELADEDAVRAVRPDFAALREVPRMAVVTARGDRETIASKARHVIELWERSPGVDPRYATIALRSAGSRSPGSVSWWVDGRAWRGSRLPLTPGEHLIRARTSRGDSAEVRIVVE